MTVEFIASLIIPAVILLCAVLMIRQKEGGSFVRGARGGLNTAVSLIPAMIMLTVGLTMFSQSGAVEWMAKVLQPVTDFLGIPSGLLPLIVTRPVSGAASTATYADLIARYGPDSPEGLSASILMGSSDTLIYVISVYFSGAKGVKRTKYAFPVAAVVMIVCILLSCFVSRWFFG